jgi:RHS repeat-associated protein
MGNIDKAAATMRPLAAGDGSITANIAPFVAAGTPPTPTLSGANNAYPLNPMIDGDVKGVGNPLPNADLQQPSFNTGTPPTNVDLETAPVNVVTVPNGGFGSGSFANWTKNGTGITIQSDATHTNWARYTTVGESLTSAAVTIPSTAQELVYDIKYIASGYSGFDIYVLTGANYGQSTLIKTDNVFNGGGWSTSFVNIVAYRSQSVKFKFVAKNVNVGLDNVKVQQVFPGWDIIDSPIRKTEGTGNGFAEISGSLTSSAFTVDAASQYLTFRVRNPGGSTAWKLYIAQGPTFGTFNQVASGGSEASWSLQRFNIQPYIGQQIKVRIGPWFGNTQVDDIGLMRVEIPRHTIADDAVLVDDGSGNTYAKYHGNGLTTEAITVPADAQNVLLRARTDPDSGIYQNVPISVTVLSGPGFGQSTGTGTVATTNSWATYRFGIGKFVGESVKLRISSGSGTLDVDDLGPFEQVLPGWSTLTDAIKVGQDSHGTYVEGANAGATIRSSWIDPGLIGSGRSYRIGFQVGTCQACIYQVTWTNEAGQGWVVLSAGAPQGQYREARITLPDLVGPRGYFTVALINGNGARLYSLGDNVARQQLSEPFSRKVGRGIDTTTGSVQVAETDVAVPGPIPITFTRYYNSHSDLLGSLGYRWSSTFDTRLEVDSGSDASVVFGSGREEFFDESFGSYTPFDRRVHSSLVKEADGTFTYTTKERTKYRFTSVGALTSIVDANGNQLTMGRDGQGRLTSVTGGGGTAITLGYDASGRLSTVTDPAGATTSYGYNANDDLVTVTDAANGVRTYTYAGHLLDTARDENGDLVVDNDFDGVFRIVKQTDALNKSVLVSYDTPGKGATRVTDPLGKQADFYFDSYQRTTYAVDGSGRVVRNIYDANGNLDKVVDPAGNEWDFTFNASGDLTATSDPVGNPSSITYNAQHLPTTVKDGRGFDTTFTYDADGNVTSITDPLNHTRTFTWDGAGNLLTATNALNQTTTFTYDAAGHVLTMTNPLDKTWTYTYDAAGRLKTEEDPLGNVTTYVYDILGHLLRVRDPLLRETTFLWDPAGHLLRVTNPADEQTNWFYDGRGLVWKKVDPAGKETLYGYDADQRMTSITDPLLRVTTYDYDAAGRLTKVTDPMLNKTVYTYDQAGRLSTVKDPLDRVTSYGYDAAGRLSSTTLPNTGVWTYGHDADGRLTSITDPLTHTTTNEYDAAGRLKATVDPLLHRTTFGYDNADRLTVETDPLGHSTSFGYDAAGQRTSITNALDQATTYTYDAAGRLTATKDATNRTTTYEYDAAGQLLKVIDNAGRAVTSTYDAAGRLESERLPSGALTSFDYNSRGLLTSVTDPLLRQTTYAYDDAGQRTAVTDPRNNTTSYAYDGAGRLKRITDALTGQVQLGYDAAGQLTSITDPRSFTWDYGFDALGHRTSVTDPLDRSTSWEFDLAGRLKKRTDARSIVTSYGYDDADRLTSVTYPGGSISYGYDAADRRTSMSDPTGSTTWGYDDADRISSVVAPAGTISYGYDAAGRRTTMGLPSSRTIGYAYDSVGRLGSMTDPADRTVTFGYDVDGNRTSIARPNGVDSTYAYDDAGQVTSIVHAKGAATLQSFAYTYDGAGNRKSVISAAGTETYTYDALDRLTNVSYPGGPTVAYTYDAAGNRKTETRGGSSTTYAYDDAGQLVSVGSSTYGYDANGNLTSAGTDTYGWDFDNRLTSASVGTHSATWRYDGDGVRTRAVVDGGTKDLLVDRAGGLPTVVDDGSAAYLHSGGLISKVDGSGATWALGDALGSVRGLTDGSGSVTGTASWEAFGAPRASSGASTTFGFAGEPSDATGLVYLRARSLDTGIGRMLSADAIRPNAAGTTGYNLYVYAADNPATWVDPSGHFVSPQDVAANFGVFLASGPIVQTTVASVLGAGAACQATIGQVGFSGRTACTDATAAVLAERLFYLAMVGLGLAFLCSSIPGCISEALEFAGVISAQGSTGTANQLKVDPRDAAEDHPSPPPIELPGPVNPPGGQGTGGGPGTSDCDPPSAAAKLTSQSGLREPPLVIDASLGANPQAVAELLRIAGFRAATVTDLWGADPGDDMIRCWAEEIDARVVTSDRARDPGGGFGQQTLWVDQRLTIPSEAVRWVEAALLGGF